MSSRVAALLLLVAALLPVACSKEVRAAREIGAMDSVTAMTHSVEVHKQGLALLDTVRDEPSAQAAAEHLDLLAYRLEQVAARLRVIGPPTADEQLTIVGGSLGELLSGGIDTAGQTLRLLGQPKLLAIINPANKRFQAAMDDLNEALAGR